jgi:hypothetical protein
MTFIEKLQQLARALEEFGMAQDGVYCVKTSIKFVPPVGDIGDQEWGAVAQVGGARTILSKSVDDVVPEGKAVLLPGENVTFTKEWTSAGESIETALDALVKTLLVDLKSEKGSRSSALDRVKAAEAALTPDPSQSDVLTPDVKEADS